MNSIVSDRLNSCVALMLATTTERELSSLFIDGNIYADRHDGFAAAQEDSFYGNDIAVVSTGCDGDMIRSADAVVGWVEVDPAKFAAAVH